MSDGKGNHFKWVGCGRICYDEIGWLGFILIWEESPSWGSFQGRNGESDGI
jgi:hypothetical protein